MIDFAWSYQQYSVHEGKEEHSKYESMFMYSSLLNRYPISAVEEISLCGKHSGFPFLISSYTVGNSHKTSKNSSVYDFCNF